MKGYLVLEDGRFFEGRVFGAKREVLGEVVFATGMTGYQESLTDPSYCGQILVASYPLIGNYGTNPVDIQSEKVQVWGYAVKEACSVPSHRDSNQNIDGFLTQDDVPGISGVDTRALIRHIRNFGTMKGAISSDNPERVLERIRTLKHPEESNLVAEVSTRIIKRFEEGKEKTVALIDCGLGWVGWAWASKSRSNWRPITLATLSVSLSGSASRSRRASTAP